MEHEMAKLLGAPPGYLGHRETVPMITQQALTEVISQDCDLALVLIDEIEKGPVKSRAFFFAGGLSLHLLLPNVSVCHLDYCRGILGSSRKELKYGRSDNGRPEW